MTASHEPSKTASHLRAIRPDIPAPVAEQKAGDWWRHLRTVAVGCMLVAAGMWVRDYTVISVLLVLAGVFLAVNGGDVARHEWVPVAACGLHGRTSYAW